MPNGTGAISARQAASARIRRASYRTVRHSPTGGINLQAPRPRPADLSHRRAGKDRIRPDQDERLVRTAAMEVEGSPGSPAGHRVSRPARGRRRSTVQAMSLEQLEYWIERLKPPPLIKGVSMLDGYLTAIIVGPCTIDPYEWMRHMLGPHSTVGSDGSEQFAAMQAIAARFNAIGEGLATAPSQYAPIFERTDDAVPAGTRHRA